ncbi:C39 family peptidase [Romboutsia ilealis]|uniref:C39 family peptidase n=1 Tax=Romboutsia ilealis TaxID=1115758 RepID=UPI00272CA0D5|nr:C39 family peptidase [Romboutsia ilealis]
MSNNKGKVTKKSNTNLKWFNNVAKSLGYATTDLVTELVPASSEFVKSNYESTTELVNNMRQNRSSGKRFTTQLGNIEQVKIGQTALRNALEDIKSGKIYNKEREDSFFDSEIDSAGSESFGIDFGDDDFSFGDDFDSDDEFEDVDIDDSDPNVTNVKKVNVKNVNNNIERSVNMLPLAKAMSNQTNAIVTSIQGSSQVQTALTGEFMMMYNNTSTATVGGLTAINDNLSLLVDFQNNSMSKYIGASLKYYEDNLKKIDDSLELLRDGFSGKLNEDTSRKQSKNDGIDPFLGNGGLDIKEYIKLVKSNIRREAEANDMASALGMFWNDTDTLREMATNPLKMVLNGAMKSAIPKSLKEKLSNVDETFSNFFPALLNRVASTKDSDNPILQMVNTIFGVNPKVKRSIDLGNYNKGVIGFDGESKKALVEVIPTYLRKIESALSGSEEKIYDYSTGKFKSAKKLKEDYENEVLRTKTSGYGSFKSEFKEIAKSFNIGSEEELKTFYDEIDRYLVKMTDRGKAINPLKQLLPNGEILDELTDNGLFVGMDDMREVFGKIYKMLPKKVQTELLGSGINMSMSKLDKFNSDIELNPHKFGYAALNNGIGVNEMFTEKNGKLVLKKGTLTSGSVDKFGLSQIDYLRDIRQILSKGIVTFPHNTSGGTDNFINPHQSFLDDTVENSKKYKSSNRFDKSNITNGNKEAYKVNDFYELNNLPEDVISDIVNKRRNNKNNLSGFKSSGLYKFLDKNEKLHGLRDVADKLIGTPIKVLENMSEATEDLMFTALHGTEEEIDIKQAYSDFKDKIFGDLPKGSNATLKFEGILPPKVAKFFSENKLQLKVGGGLGLLGSFFLPGGPIAGTILGMGTGLATKADWFQQFLYGDNFKDEKNWKSGFFGKALNKFGGKLEEWGIDPKYSAFLSTGGAGLGLLSSFFLPFGPVGGSLLGLAGGITASSDKFQTWLFGEKGEDDKRRGGFLTKFTNWFDINVKDKMLIKMSEIGLNISDFFYDSISEPFLDAIAPLKHMFADVADKTKEMFYRGWETINENVFKVFHENVAKPFGETMEKFVLDPLKKFMNKTLSLAGKVLGGIISAPFKALGLVGDKVDAKNEKKALKSEKQNRWDNDVQEMKEKFINGEIKFADLKNFIKRRGDLKGSEKEAFLQEVLPYRDRRKEDKENRRKAREEKRETKLQEIRNRKLANQDKRDFAINHDYKYTSQEQIDLEKEQINLFRAAKEQGEESVIALKSINNIIDNIGDKNDDQVSMLKQIRDLIAQGPKAIFDTAKDKISDKFITKSKNVSQERRTLRNNPLIRSFGESKIEGSHASGLDNVPRDGYVAELHEGEMIIPAQQANILRQQAGVKKERASKVKGQLNDSNDIVNSLDKRLIGTKNDYIRRIARDTRIIAAEVKGQLDGVGNNVFKTRKILQNAYGIEDSDIAGSANKSRQGFMGKLRHAMFKPLDFLKDFVYDNIMKPINWVREKIQNVTEWFGNAFESMKNFGKSIVSTGAKVVGAVGKTALKVVDGLVDVGNVVGKMFVKGAGRVISDIYGGAKFLVTNAFKGIFKGFESIGKVALATADTIGNAANFLGNAMVDIAKGMYTFTKDVSTLLYKGIKGTFKTAAKIATGVVKGVVGTIKGTVSGAIKGVNFITNKLFNRNKDSVLGANKVQIVGGRLDSVGELESPVEISKTTITNIVNEYSNKTLDVNVKSLPSGEQSGLRPLVAKSAPVKSNVVQFPGIQTQIPGSDQFNKVVKKNQEVEEKKKKQEEENNKHKEYTTRKTANYVKEENEKKKEKAEFKQYTKVMSGAAVATAKTSVEQYNFWDKIFGKNGKVSRFMETIGKLFSGLKDVFSKFTGGLGNGLLGSGLNLLKTAAPMIVPFLLSLYEKNRVNKNLENGADNVVTAWLGQGDERRLNGDGEYVYDGNRTESYAKLPLRQGSRAYIAKLGTQTMDTLSQYGNVAKEAFTNTFRQVGTNGPNKKTMLNTIGEKVVARGQLFKAEVALGADLFKDKHAELIQKTTSVLDNIVTSICTAVQKKFPKLAGQASSISKNIVSLFTKAASDKAIFSKFSAKLTNFFVELGAGAATAGVLDVGLAAWDATTGFMEAANLFGVHTDQVDLLMRVISSVMKTITKFSVVQILDIVNDMVAECLGLNVKRQIATLIYQAIPFGDSEKLKINQDAIDAELEAYNSENNTNMSKEAYLDMVSPTVADKLLGSDFTKNFLGTFSKNQAAKYMNKDASELSFMDRLAYAGAHTLTSFGNFFRKEENRKDETGLMTAYKNTKSIFSKSGAQQNMGLNQDAKLSLVDRVANTGVTLSNTIANLFRSPEEKRTNSEAMSAYATKRNTKAQEKIDKANAILEDEDSNFFQKQFAKISKSRNQKKLGIETDKQRKKREKKEEKQNKKKSSKKNASKNKKTASEDNFIPDTGYNGGDDNLDMMYMSAYNMYMNGLISDEKFAQYKADAGISDSYYDNMINKGKNKSAGYGAGNSKTTEPAQKAVSIKNNSDEKVNVGKLQKDVDKSLDSISKSMSKNVTKISKSFTKGMNKVIKSLEKDMKKVDRDISKGFNSAGNSFVKSFKKLIKEMDKVTSKTTKNLTKNTKKEMTSFEKSNKNVIEKTEELIETIGKKVTSVIDNIKGINLPSIQLPDFSNIFNFGNKSSSEKSTTNNSSKNSEDESLLSKIKNIFSLGKGGQTTTTPAPITNKTENINNFTYYSQNDNRWGNKKLIGGETVADAGCGPTSLAMVMSQMHGKQITPDMIASMAPENLPGFSTPDLFPNIARKFNTNAHDVRSIKEVKEQLKQGRPVIISGKGVGTNNPYTKEGHIVVATGLDGDNIIVNDPRGAGLSKPYTAEELENGFNLGYTFTKPGQENERFIPEYDPHESPGATGDNVDIGKAGSSGGQVRLFDKVIQYARAFKGKLKYSMDTNVRNWINNGKLGADCSSFTQHVFKTVAGIDIGANTGQQLTKGGTEISVDNAQPGDLILFKGTYNSSHPRGVSHVGIVSDNNGNMIDQGSSGAAPKERSYLSSYWKSKLLTAVRPLTNPNQMVDPTVSNGNKAIGTVVATPSGIPDVSGGSAINTSTSNSEVPQVNTMGAFDLMSNAFQNYSASVWNGKEVDLFATQNTSTDSTGTTTDINGREVKALFTAYYPANNKLQGGYKDAMGNQLDLSKMTCAAPKEIPFGTKIQVKGTGTEKDGQIYTVTDRGGAIKVRGDEYQFDLLMKDHDTAYSWGRKSGSAVVGDSAGKGPNYGYTGDYPDTMNNFAYYSQADPRWANTAIDDSDLATAGCGPTTSAMVMTQLTGRRYLPSTILNVARDHIDRNGSKWSLFPYLAKQFKTGIKESITSVSKIKSELEQGNPVILSGTNSKSNSPYTKAGHIVAAVGMDGENVLINDPRSPQHTKAYSKSQIESGLRGGWSFSKLAETANENVPSDGSFTSGTTQSNLGSETTNTMGAFDLMSNAFQNYSASVWNGKEVDLFATQNTSTDSTGTTPAAAKWSGTEYDLSKYDMSGLSSTKQSHIMKIIHPVLETFKTHNLLPSVTIAQSVGESGWGPSSGLATKGNNLFGIKTGSKWTGKSYSAKTGEFLNGKNVTITDSFRAYDSMADSVIDRANFLSGSRYKAMMSKNTPKEQFQAMKDGGYATDPNYVSKMMKIVNDSKLTRFDNPKPPVPKSAGKGGDDNISKLTNTVDRQTSKKNVKYAGKGGNNTSSTKISMPSKKLPSIKEGINKLTQTNIIANVKNGNGSLTDTCVELISTIIDELKSINTNTANTVNAVKEIEIVPANASVTQISNQNTNVESAKQKYNGRTLPLGTDKGYDLAKRIASFA